MNAAPAGPTRAIVYLPTIAENLRGIRERVGPHRGILMAVKADAYGHGAVEVSRYVEREGLVDWFGVATLGEGLELREAGIRSPILKFAPTPPGEQTRAAVAAGITLSVASRAEADAVEVAAAALRTRASVHVAVETGMGRIGLAYRDVQQFAEHTREHCPHVRVQGMFTHFPVSDTIDDESVAFTGEQIGVLRRSVATCSEALGYLVEMVHAANSGGVLGHPGSWGNLVRPGIMAYGYYPDSTTPRTIAVRPALEWRAPITFVKRVKAGQSISYGRTWTAPSDTWVATLPVGYADGYRRLLSNTGRVLAHGRSHPVVGRVCMDQTMIDMGGMAGRSPLQVGEEVVLLGESGNQRYTAAEMATDLGTISYEVLTLIGARVRREYRE